MLTDGLEGCVQCSGTETKGFFTEHALAYGL